MLVNLVGLTTQVPMIYEVVSNNATTDYRKIMISKTEVIVRRPKVSVTNENVRSLQFLDLNKDVDVYSEEEGDDLKRRMLEIMKKLGITFSALEPYLSYYPEKIYKNMYETGCLQVYLHEDREQFLDAIRIVAGHTGLSEVVIEKDYYITMILKLLSQKLTFLVFKGGTSL
ncbi:hypothetical protein [Parablautia intestinalis]|uniref:hypothetical protein n=1 Tax=Parablautia intestinalis TaxID=2320100 RepID=UPI00259C7C48|nr:hypothetical protein [Parablautia intestinalis]